MGQDIRVLVVDDSPLIREIVSDAITATSGVSVAGLAEDGNSALKIFRSQPVDVVTLDFQMPGMDGLETLEKLLNIRSVPVIMASAQTSLGANVTLDALDCGALDYIPKPSGMAETRRFGEDLVNKIKLVANCDVEKLLASRRSRSQKRAERKLLTESTLPLQASQGHAEASFTDKLIAIGISTGGPPALNTVFESLAAPLPPIVIVQHMPQHFTKSFAARLDERSQLTVKEAESGDLLQPNFAYIAPGGRHMELMKTALGTKIRIFDADPVSGHRPSVDVMMKSAAKIFGDRCLGVIMTGMGRDGSDGCGGIRSKGGYVFGQDGATSDVYGMNKVAMQEGNVDKQFALEELPNLLRRQCKKLWKALPTKVC